MYEKVVALLSEYLKVDKSMITPETDIRKDLNADSLVVVEMLFNLEDEYNITIPDDMVDKLTKVGDLVTYLENETKK